MGRCLPLGALLGFLLDPSWSVLGAFGAVLKQTWAVQKPSWPVRDTLGTYLEAPGMPGEAAGRLRGRSQSRGGTLNMRILKMCQGVVGGFCDASCASLGRPWDCRRSKENWGARAWPHIARRFSRNMLHRNQRARFARAQVLADHRTPAHAVLHPLNMGFLVLLWL